MPTPPPQGRLIAVLLVLQLAGLIVPFAMLHPMLPANYLATAAASATQVKTAIALLFVTGGLTIALSLALWPVVREHSEGAGLLLLAASVVMFTLQAVDNAHLLSLLSLSEQYAADPNRSEVLNTLAEAVRSTRRWVHYSSLFAIDLWILTLYAVLHRFALVPRWVTLFGAATVLLHFSGIILPFYLGHSSVMPLGVPMAAGHLVLAGWLATRGFARG